MASFKFNRKLNKQQEEHEEDYIQGFAEEIYGNEDAEEISENEPIPKIARAEKPKQITFKQKATKKPPTTKRIKSAKPENQHKEEAEQNGGNIAVTGISQKRNTRTVTKGKEETTNKQTPTARKKVTDKGQMVTPYDKQSKPKELTRKNSENNKDKQLFPNKVRKTLTGYPKVTESKVKEMLAEEIIVYNKHAYSTNAMKKKGYPTIEEHLLLNTSGETFPVLGAPIITKSNEVPTDIIPNIAEELSFGETFLEELEGLEEPLQLETPIEVMTLEDSLNNLEESPLDFDAVEEELVLVDPETDLLANGEVLINEETLQEEEITPEEEKSITTEESMELEQMEDETTPSLELNLNESLNFDTSLDLLDSISLEEVVPEVNLQLDDDQEILNLLDVELKLTNEGLDDMQVSLTEEAPALPQLDLNIGLETNIPTAPTLKFTGESSTIKSDLTDSKTSIFNLDVKENKQVFGTKHEEQKPSDELYLGQTYAIEDLREDRTSEGLIKDTFLSTGITETLDTLPEEIVTKFDRKEELLNQSKSLEEAFQYID